MTTVKVKFRPSAVADRQGSIIYLVTHHRVVRQITTDYKIYEYEWDKKISMVVFSDSEKLRIIHQSIRWDLSRLHKIINEYNSRYCEYSSNDIVAEFKELCKQKTLFDYMQSVIYRFRQLNQIGTANNYNAALNSFKRFRCEENIPIDAIDHILMENYQAFLRIHGLSLNSISFYMRILRAVYNRAIEQGVTDDKKPFRHVFTGSEKTQKRAVSLQEIKRIRNLDLSLKPNLELARDIFLFLFYCRGMSFIDAAFLEKKDIKNGVITYRRHKTGQVIHVKIVRQIREIIDLYSVGNSPYLLPIISETSKDKRKQYESALHKINNGLKEIGKLAKMPIPITTYVSRHSWATIAKYKRIPISVISDALGHDSEITTQIYLASIDMSIIDRANELIIRDL
ncbi:MAG: site-specific integrase [Prevotella sp.]|nr:site-specific integrase [Prevotella sp.]